MLATLIALIPTAMAVLYGLGLVASAIARATKTTRDDELAAWLVQLHDFLSKLVPGGSTLAQKRAPAPELPPVVKSR